MIHVRNLGVGAIFAVAVAACGTTATATVDTGAPEGVPPVGLPDQSDVGEREQVLCEPGPSGNVGADTTVDPDRRAEALVFHLTGIDETVALLENEGEEIIFDDPNYGGVYGDFNGGIVVAVVDCSLVDADRIAELAGGPDVVQLIEVPYSFEEVNGFRDALLHEDAEVSIESTVTGRWIVVTVEAFDDLPDNYGSSVPEDVFTIVEGELSTDLDQG